jgi:AcrR family transcriptional regulator
MESGPDREGKRTTIVLAVLRVIAIRGLGAVSIRSVAAEAGVSAGRVQHYFGSKRELIRASTAFMISAAEARHFDTGTPRSLNDELWEILTHALPLASKSPAGTSVFYSLVAASVADPELAAILSEAKSGVEDLIAHQLADLVPSLADPQAAARHLLALSDGLTLQVLIGHQTADQAHATLRTALDTYVKS